MSGIFNKYLSISGWQRLWMNTAIVFLGLVALLGALMRFLYLWPQEAIAYKHVLHAHSHVAMLGWAFMLVCGYLIFAYLKRDQEELKEKYQWVFYLSVVSAAGMFCSFLIQGYGLYSIAFSSLHIITACYFAYHFFRDLTSMPNTASKLFIQWSLFWMLFSMLGIIAIGPISSGFGNTSSLFFMSVQFFLHFQFNGWFTFALIGIWLHHIEQSEGEINIPNSYIWLLNLSLLLTYALSVSWSQPSDIIFYLNSGGVILQAVAFYLILKQIFNISNPFKQHNNWLDKLLVLGILCLVIKVCVQLLVAIPAIAELSYAVRNFIVGFIHLIMLGSVTFPVVAILLKQERLPVNKICKSGWSLFMLGFIFKELLLFIQGLLLILKKGFLPYYHELIFGITALLPLAVITLWVGHTYQSKIKSANQINHFQLKSESI